jgi:hypothetical protein
MPAEGSWKASGYSIGQKVDKQVNTTLQRHCSENWKQIFPEMKLSGLVPNVHILVSVSDLLGTRRVVSSQGIHKSDLVCSAENAVHSKCFLILRATCTIREIK